MALLEETLFGTHDKVAIAIQRLRTFEPPEGYYLAFSGGKDSEVVITCARKRVSNSMPTTVIPPSIRRRSSTSCGSIIPM